MGTQFNFFKLYCMAVFLYLPHLHIFNADGLLVYFFSYIFISRVGNTGLVLQCCQRLASNNLYNNGESEYSGKFHITVHLQLVSLIARIYYIIYIAV